MLAHKISASRLRGLPSSLSNTPMRCMQFSGDDTLVLGYIDCTVKVVELKVSNSLPQISNIISSKLPTKGLYYPLTYNISTVEFVSWNYLLY